MRGKGLPALTLLLLLAGSGLAQEAGGDFIRAHRPEPLPASLAKALDGLETARLTKHMAYLSDPRREGRGLGTRGLEATVRYLEGQLKAAGLAPLGASYRQPVPMREVRPVGGSIALRLGSESFTFRAGREAILPALAPGTLAGPLVFVGFGIQEPALGHDDYRGLDVRGKVVVFLEGCPTGEDWRKPDLIEKYDSPRRADRYDARLALLEKLGARAAIALEEGLERRIAAGKEPALPYFLAARDKPAPGAPPLGRVALAAGLRERLTTRAEGRGTLTVQGRVRAIRGFNVLGRLEGTDPKLRQEAILLGAHMDHLGMPGGVLHPGADDNASGVSALLEIARSLAARPHRPRRTLLFAFWTGEEEGKFGSNHFTRHPRWPLADTKAYLNLDMIGHPWTPAELRALVVEAKAPKGFLEGLDPAHFAEPGPSSAHRDLGPILAQAGRGTGMSLHLDWTDGKHGGSDYRAFARLNLPFVRFFGSYFPDYHRPGDTLDQLDPEQVKRMARLVLTTAWLLADR
ncbi:MAG: M20/M25/M40 family metallo-hydrolase [Holophagaceae bacterium]|uniref:M20/M25/M40 family metallo-hydrolase n=1 Tax=Candidatus Geothrix skivensis TaxID=2954439 RepID=A0A9D7SI55_9BACT|nr:M20/M25/M40 family metallo-hydrolase [Candidatus Geothrix skivensis]